MLRLPPLSHIGPEQIAELIKSTPGAVLGQLVNATIVAFALFAAAGPAAVGAWWALNLFICCWTLLRWYRNRNRIITRISRKAIPRAALSGALLALPWSLLVIFYLGSIPHHEELLMSIAVLGMAAAGSVQLARIYPAALAYLGMILVPVFLKSLWVGEKQYFLLALLTISYFCYLLSSVINSAVASMERSAALKDVRSKVAELDKANDALEKFAAEDDLTGLLNRRIFQQRLSAAVEEARDSGCGFTLLICDLDHFKNVNDASGHAAGDHLLQQVAERLNACAGARDVVARIGGDEFAIIAFDPQTTEETIEFIRQLMDAVNRPVAFEGTRLDPGISIGISVFPFDAQVPQALMSHADMALQNGKAQSRGRYWFFDHQMRAKLIADEAMEADLRNALEQGEFELFYQPKIEFRSGRLCGFESLLRWRRADGEIVSPGVFFPVAEERGLMTQISDYVAARFVADVGGWLDRGLDPGNVSMNVHPVQVKDRNRMKKLARKVWGRSIPPEKLTLEITEECVVGRGTDGVPEVLRFMRDQNFRISLDDFGTGYASLTHLKDLPVDEIKLDRSFVADLLDSSSDRAIVHAMIKLAESLGLATVAEGVEDQQQHTILLEMGCAIGQGYLYGRPMDLETATDYLRASSGGFADGSSKVIPLDGYASGKRA